MGYEDAFMNCLCNAKTLFFKNWPKTLRAWLHNEEIDRDCGIGVISDK